MLNLDYEGHATRFLKKGVYRALDLVHQGKGSEVACRHELYGRVVICTAGTNGTYISIIGHEEVLRRLKEYLQAQTSPHLDVSEIEKYLGEVFMYSMTVREAG